MELTYIGVFMAGLLSFFSPCIVPLIPMYIGFLAGEINPEGHKAKGLYLNALGFLLGLMLVFILLGAVATAIGSFLLGISSLLRQVSGVVIVIFGVFQLGLIKWNFLTRTRQVRVRVKSAKFGSAFLMGMAFSFGWTPCVGPILGTVLLYAANTQTLQMGIFLLVIYALGFIVPFMLSTVLMERAAKWFEGSGPWLGYMKWVSGLLMIAVGLLIYFNYLTRLTVLFS